MSLQINSLSPSKWHFFGEERKKVLVGALLSQGKDSRWKDTRFTTLYLVSQIESSASSSGECFFHKPTVDKTQIMANSILRANRCETTLTRFERETSRFFQVFLKETREQRSSNRIYRLLITDCGHIFDDTPEVNAEIQDIGCPICSSNSKTIFSETQLCEKLMKKISSSSPQELEDFLKTSPIDINVQDDDGFTPLMRAAKTGSLEKVKIILSQPGVKFYSSFGVSAASIAKKAGHEDVATLIETQEHSLEEKQESRFALIAIERGDNELLKKILSKKPNSIYERDDEGRTPLMLAAIRGNFEAVEEILRLDKNCINDLDNDGCNAFMLAAANGHLKIAMYLPLHDANIHQRSFILDQSAILLAAKGGHSRIIEFLVKGLHLSIEDHDYLFRTPLSLAAMEGHEKATRYILYELKAFKSLDLMRRSPAMLAAMNGRLEIVKLFVNDDKSVLNEKDGDDCNMLMIAAYYEQAEVVDYLVSLKEQKLDEVTSHFRRSALNLAAEAGFTHIAKLLLRAKASTRVCDHVGASPLFTACDCGWLSMSRLLLSERAYVNAGLKKEQVTPLIACAEKGRIEIAESLLDAGAELDKQDADRRTALTAAATYGQHRMARFLISMGASTQTRDLKKQTPLMHAVKSGCLETVKIFIEEDSSLIDLQDDEGKTALIIAVEKNKEDIVLLLLESGASLTIRDQDGQTAFVIATKKNKILANKMLPYLQTHLTKS